MALIKGSESEVVLTPPVGHEQSEAISTPRVDVGDDIIVTDTRWSFGGNTHEHFDEHVNRIDQFHFTSTGINL